MGRDSYLSSKPGPSGGDAGHGGCSHDYAYDTFHAGQLSGRDYIYTARAKGVSDRKITTATCLRMP